MAGLISVIGLLPLIFFFVGQPDLLLERPAQIAIVGQTASPADSTIAGALWATAAMFGPFGSPGDLDPRRNIPGAPALNLWQAIPFYLGLTLALWQSVRHGKGAVVMALPLLGLVALLLPGVFSEYAPHFHRILGAAAPAALLCGIGLDGIWKATTRLQTPLTRWSGPALALLLVVAGTVNSAQDYFVRWARLPDLFYAFDEGIWELGKWVAQQQNGEAIYISPEGESHPTLAFAWRYQPSKMTQTVPPMPISYDGRYLFPLVAGANQYPEHYAVIKHEDFRTPLLLPELFPSATVEVSITDPAGEVYALVYKRPANSPPVRAPKNPLNVSLGDGIHLVGYDILPQPLQVGGSLYVQYYWQVDAPPSADWTVFTHLLDGSGRVVAGFDSPPGRGSLVTTRWQPGWRVLDEYELMLPADLPVGDYTLQMGMYDSAGNTLPPGGAAVELGKISLAK